MTLITINGEKCRKDGLCVRVCPNVFEQGSKDRIPEVAHEESCNLCGHCLMICPSGAICHRDLPPESLHEVRRDLMPSYEQVKEMLLTRRSTRSFHDRPVEKVIIEQVIEGARFAPTAKNSQSTRYMVITDRALLREIASATARWLGKIAKRLENPLWRKLYLLLGEGDAEEVTRWIGQFERIAQRMGEQKDLILFDAPVLVLFHAEKHVRFADANGNLAVENATLLASALGLGSFYTGYVVSAWKYDKTVRKLIRLPEKHKLLAGLALGYPGLRFTRWIDRPPGVITWR